ALVDKNVEKHKNRAAVEAFIQFLHTEKVQKAFAEYGFRPVDLNVLDKYKDTFPIPKYQFDINFLGGWDKVGETLYGSDGIWTRIFEEQM
ncbi:MAG: substrate-binding domain-containing protein, partial [Candidatus Marinimicrobia bacterium]|nr:substrate-binding domain-containing protein [Candidatus Neomarinimicrobiota bacterium]